MTTPDMARDMATATGTGTGTGTDTAGPYDALRALVAAGSVEEVIVAVPDLQGRLQGSRLSAPYFLDEVARHGFGACVYLLASDVEDEHRRRLRHRRLAQRLR